MAINYRRSFGLKGPAWSLLALFREDKVGKKVHIVPNGTGWQVKPEGSSIPTSTHRTQQAATDAGTPCCAGAHPAARGLSPVSCLGYLHARPRRAMLRLVLRLPVKWVFDPFVDERYAIARGLSPVCCHSVVVGGDRRCQRANTRWIASGVNRSPSKTTTLLPNSPCDGLWDRR